VYEEWLEGLYVIPERWGTGLAGELHDRAVEVVRELGSERCHLWVLEDNARARRFYERRGWREDGRTRVVEFPPNPLDIGHSRITSAGDAAASDSTVGQRARKAR
jgi:RimJ/RimL family protein N-acetyltransferase